jgi:hypothetical protein
MKKITLAILVLAVLAFGLASCDNGTTSSVTPPTPVDPGSPVVGTWRSFSVTNIPAMDITFLDSKNVKINHIIEGWTGTGSYTYNEIECYIDGSSLN